MNKLNRLHVVTPLIMGLAISGCSSKPASDTAASGDSAKADVAAGSLEGSANVDTAKSGSVMGEGMPAMAGMGGGMMDSMNTHMQMMKGVSADKMKAMMPAHRQMAANMLSQLNSEMRKMNMQPDQKWKALTDSIRQDLVRIPEISSGETLSFMSGHNARMMRLMEMHRSMMGGMKM